MYRDLRSGQISSDRNTYAAQHLSLPNVGGSTSSRCQRWTASKAAAIPTRLSRLPSALLCGLGIRCMLGWMMGSENTGEPRLRRLLKEVELASSTLDTDNDVFVCMLTSVLFCVYDSLCSNEFCENCTPALKAPSYTKRNHPPPPPTNK